MEDNGITEELINEILAKVKIYLGLTDNAKDTLLILYINMICNNILIKTNRRKFVPNLKYVVIELVKNKFECNKTDDEIKSIMSMTEYDRTVNFGTTGALKTKLDLIAQRQLEENETLINRYKLLYRT